MEERDSGLYQVEYFAGVEKKARRFDIVIGSGVMGQSFLNWRADKLFQLPITYFSAAGQWSNSPGFPDKVVFNRVITSRCLECHTTFASVTDGGKNGGEMFDKRSIIYGVDCEKCHGPAKLHVKYQTENPSDSNGRYVVNPARLSRQQNLDLCALCHGGRLQKKTPSFSFVAGNKLADHFLEDTARPNPAAIDVHGNQYGLLRASKCFTMSETLNCGSCHNSHKNERGNTAIFSKRCVNCHQPEHGKLCNFIKGKATTLKENCIDCHMPLQPSKAIAVFLPDKPLPVAANIRSHFISVYLDATNNVLNDEKNRSASRPK